MSVVGSFYSLSLKPINFGRDIMRSRRLIIDLTRREFQARHLGSALGFIWAFTHPAIMMLIYWYVFTQRMNLGAMIAGKPFLLWILSGLVPWFLASDCVAGGASAIMDNRFLIKKVVFRVSLLPVIRLLSNLPVHLFLLMVITSLFWAMGYPPSWYNLQLLYYLFATLMLGLGWTLLMSAMVPFLKDIGQIVQVILQIAFWVTPLIWHIEDEPVREQGKAYLNPLCYIVQGYRDSLVYHRPMWEHPMRTEYYWAFTLTLLVIGGLVFSRLRAHFADVL